MSCTPTPPAGKCKGKARADACQATETTPLLSAGSSSTAVDESASLQPQAQPPHRTLLKRLLISFSIALLTCIVLLLFAMLVGYSYASRASQITPDNVLDHGLTYRGPDRMDVLNVTENGQMWVQVNARVGVDVGKLLGLQANEDDLVWTALWKGLGRWGVHKLDKVSVALSPIQITRFDDQDNLLAEVQVASPLTLPLSTQTPPPDDLSWLTPISMSVLVTPTKDTPDLVRFARDSWSLGTINVAALIDTVRIQGGAPLEGSWRKNVRLEQSNVQTGIHIRIPALPGLPNPGRDKPFPAFSDLITLKDFSLFSGLTQLSLNASATFVNPAPQSVSLTVPSLPFTAFIPSPGSLETRQLFPVAVVNSAAFSLTHPNITLDISGRVLPMGESSSSALSLFVTNYLSGRSSEISISTPLLPNVTIDTVFPARYPKPEVLRNVTIKDMRIKPLPNGTILASGAILAVAVLPKGMNVAVDVLRVYPELLVYDGEVPSDNVQFYHDYDKLDSSLPDPIPLPDPLPPRAFAHIRPEAWIESRSVPTEAPEGEGSAVVVSAKMVDVPLRVLPGRQTEFSKFVGKVVFGTKGAIAGVSGIAAVGINIEGLAPGGKDGEAGMELHGLPFRGAVPIGKKGWLD